MACDSCGIVFTSVGHLVKHSKVCNKDDQHGDGDSDDSKEEVEEDEEEEEGDSEDNLEERAFSVFRQEAINEIRETDAWEAKYNEFIRGNQPANQTR